MMKKMTTLILVLALSAALLIGCGAPTPQAAIPAASQTLEILPEPAAAPQTTGGVLRLKINPEIALHYDENGNVTKLEGRNPEGVQLLQNFTGYEGKATTAVLEELVQIIGQAGYFVEEAEGKARKIVLELDPGSQVPHEKFLEDMAAHVKDCIERKTWNGDREYDYQEPAPQETAAPAETTPVTKPTSPNTSAAVPAGLCPVCADDDCDDGVYCDDAHEKRENLAEHHRRISGNVCSVCGDPDCDDGAYCDDWDDRYDHH